MPAVQRGGKASLSSTTASLGGAPVAEAYRDKKRGHLRKADEISSVFGFKCRVSSPHFIALGRPNGLAFPRLAIMVTKKTARLAVKRNYMRRVVREYFRTHLPEIAPQDIIVRITKPFIQQEFANIYQEIAVIFVKLRKCQDF